MFDKRIILIAGHYGSGKTSVALSCAAAINKSGCKTALADLDIVNPYFRAKDDAEILQNEGVDFIASDFANSNVDLPALPQQLYSIIDNKERRVVVDVGGDDRGALALGRLVPAIKSENDYEMLLVINKYRPLTDTVQNVMEIKQEIDAACKIGFTGIINNSNLGVQTTAQDVKNSLQYADDCSKACGLPIVATTVASPVFEQLQDKIQNLFELTLLLRNKYI